MESNYNGNCEPTGVYQSVDEYSTLNWDFPAAEPAPKAQQATPRSGAQVISFISFFVRSPDRMLNESCPAGRSFRLRTEKRASSANNN